MSELKLTLEEELPSPDLFSDAEVGTSASTAGTSDEDFTPLVSSVAGCLEPDFNDDPEWKGVSMEEIYKHHGQFEWTHLPPIHPSISHTILFELPLPIRGPPKAHPQQPADKWNQYFVRMPHSVHSLYPIDVENESTGGFRRRWEVIQESLLQSFMTSHQLEAAMLSYNHRYAERWDFAALHNFFNDYIDDEETKMCLESLVPKIVQLALQLPQLITGPIPLLKRQSNKTISLSQLQVASLLANAFFCTFPRRNSTNPKSEYGSYPYINFNRLFSSFREGNNARNQSVMEKLKCIFHYFRRVTSKAPEGVITIQRKYIPKKNCPRWDKQHMKLPPLHITCKGTIEAQGAGLLQVDFANKYVGGGVLNYGCVQEEIRFVICPELMVTMLVTEALDDTEALLIQGAERYSTYEGYSNNFKWVGDFVDETPRDSSGRLKTCIVAIDALYFKQPNVQFNMGNVIRELNKAYVGFSSEIASNNLPAVATGNWGCGAFRGNPQLKVLVQLMAAAVAGRSIVYFTFGDANLRDSVSEMYWHLVRHDVDIARLFALISQYQEMSVENRSDFYRFLYNRSKMKPLTHYFDKNKSPDKNGKLGSENKFNAKEKTESKVYSKESNVNSKEKTRFTFDSKTHSSFAKMKEDELDEKIEKWLNEIDDNENDGKKSKRESKIEEEKREENCVIKENKSNSVISTPNKKRKSNSAVSTPNKKIESNSVISTPNKKKQTYEKAFGENSYVSPKKQILNSDIVDKSLNEQENVIEKCRSTELDTKREENVAEGKPDKRNASNEIRKIKNNTQTSIRDFFKKKDA